MPISWLDHKPHAIAVYASWPALPSAHATLATGRPATALPGPVLHRLDCTSFCWRLRKSRLVPSLVAETIRYQTPVIHMRRTATRDTELAGRHIRQGDKVVMWYISGNRDESV